MMMRPTLLGFLFALPLLTGCAGGAASTAEPVELTVAEEARLAELIARLEEVKAHPDSTLTRAEFEEIMRLRNKRDGISTPSPQPDSTGDPSPFTVIGTTLAVLLVAFVIMVNNAL